jgi:hypothetical protein
MTNLNNFLNTLVAHRWYNLKYKYCVSPNVASFGTRENVCQITSFRVIKGVN